MENNEFQHTWGNISSGIKQKKKEELDEILRVKVREIMYSDQAIFAFSIVVGFGFMLFLGAISFFRRNDLYFVINNILLALFIIYFQIRKIRMIIRLNQTKAELSVKDWLKYRIDILSHWLFDASVYFIMPIGFVLGLLSFNVFMASRPYLEIIQDEKFIFHLFGGFIIGLGAALFSMRMIRIKQISNLNRLKDLYMQINDQDTTSL